MCNGMSSSRLASRINVGNFNCSSLANTSARRNSLGANTKSGCSAASVGTFLLEVSKPTVVRLSLVGFAASGPADVAASAPLPSLRSRRQRVLQPWNPPR